MTASNPFDDALAEQALRPEQQEQQRDDVSKPAFDAGADERTPIELAELLADADDQAADDGARDRSQAAEDENGQCLEGDDFGREGDVRARAPHDAGDQRNDAGGEPHHHPNLLERDADRERRLMAVGNRAQGCLLYTSPSPR